MTILILLPMLCWCISAAMALDVVIPNDASLKELDWPDPLIAAVTHQPRVYGFSTEIGKQFFYRGHADDLNALMSELIREKKADIQIRFHTGEGEIHATDKQPNIRFDWCVTVSSKNEYPPFADKSRNLQSDWFVDIDVYPGSRLDAYKIKIPLSISAAYLDPFSDLVQLHDKRRRKMGKTGPPSQLHHHEDRFVDIPTNGAKTNRQTEPTQK